MFCETEKAQAICLGLFLSAFFGSRRRDGESNKLDGVEKALKIALFGIQRVSDEMLDMDGEIQKGRINYERRVRRLKEVEQPALVGGERLAGGRKVLFHCSSNEKVIKNDLPPSAFQLLPIKRFSTKLLQRGRNGTSRAF